MKKILHKLTYAQNLSQYEAHASYYEEILCKVLTVLPPPSLSSFLPPFLPVHLLHPLPPWTSLVLPSPPFFYIRYMAHSECRGAPVIGRVGNPAGCGLGRSAYRAPYGQHHYSCALTADRAGTGMKL